MSHDPALERLLHRRVALAQHQAPAPPSAAQLLADVRPWWSDLSARMQGQLDRLRQMPLAYGFAMTADGTGRSGYPIPALIERDEDVAVHARFLYLGVRDGRMRAQFQFDEGSEQVERAFDAIIVPDDAEREPFSGRATMSESGAYSIEAELSSELARDWSALRVTERMPFRLILRPAALDT